MAILIEGMEMPDRDHLVLVEIDSNGDVFAAYDGGRTKLTQYKASLVTEPHGRLGDLDELKTAFPCGESVRTESVRATIDHMPTVIPASEEVET